MYNEQIKDKELTPEEKLEMCKQELSYERSNNQYLNRLINEKNQEVSFYRRLIAIKLGLNSDEINRLGVSDYPSSYPSGGLVGTSNKRLY